MNPAPSSMMLHRFLPMSWTSPLTVPIRNVPTCWRPPLGQQRAQDVQRSLHGARGDQHLGHEVVAALEAGADLLQRGDEGVEQQASRAPSRRPGHPPRPGAPPVRCRRASRRRASAGSLRGSCGVLSGFAVAEALAAASGRARSESIAARRSGAAPAAASVPRCSERTRRRRPRANRDRDRGEARLELVHRGGERATAHARPARRAADAVDDRGRGVGGQLGGHRGGPEGEEHLADCRAVIVDQPPQPLAGAEEVQCCPPGLRARPPAAWEPPD